VQLEVQEDWEERVQQEDWEELEDWEEQEQLVA
jgi:hypothetical protein